MKWKRSSGCLLGSAGWLCGRIDPDILSARSGALTPTPEPTNIIPALLLSGLLVVKARRLVGQPCLSQAANLTTMPIADGSR